MSYIIIISLYCLPNINLIVSGAIIDDKPLVYDLQKLDAIAEYKIDTIKHLKRVHEEESDMNSLIF